MSRLLREGTGHLSGDIVIQGSRAAYTARSDSDLDVAVLVPPADFERLWQDRFGGRVGGTAAWRTGQHAMAMGKIQSGEAGLRGLRHRIEAYLGMDVDISVIRRGGPFDQGTRIPIR